MSAVPYEIFQSLVEASADFIGTIDRRGDLLYLNPAGRKMLEIPLDEDIVGHSIIPYNDMPSAEITEAASAILAGGDVPAVSVFVSRSGRRIMVSQSFIVHETSTGTRYSTIARDISDRVALEQSLRDRADRDPLTGLLNRAAFRQRATAWTHTPLTRLAILDLDGFKSVNDTQGHHAGDLLLRQVAERLIATLGPATLVARLGGDEFVILVEEDETDDNIDASVQTALGPLLRPFDAGVSIGVTAFCVGTDFDVAMRTADARLYDQKRLRRSRVGDRSPLTTVMVERAEPHTSVRTVFGAKIPFD